MIFSPHITLLLSYKKFSDITLLSQEIFSFIFVAKTTNLTTQISYTAPGKKCAQMHCNNTVKLLLISSAPTVKFDCYTYSKWSMVQKKSNI